MTGLRDTARRAYHGVREFVRKHPRGCRRVFDLLHPVLPNHWIFSPILAECGGFYKKSVRLGNGMPARVAMGDYVGLQIAEHGFYEEPLVKRFVSLLTPETTLFDIGAHIGQYSLVASKLVAYVHAFEPTPDTFSLLQQNVTMNRLHNVAVNNIALSDKAGKAELFLASPANPGANSLCRSQGGKRVQVVCRTLDEYVAERNIPPNTPIVLKIDVEGAEMQVLRGAEHVLERRPTMLIEVLEKTAQTEMEVFLRARGFTMANLDACNVLCTPATAVRA